MKRSEIYYQIAILLSALPEYDIDFDKDMIPAPKCLNELKYDFLRMAQCAELIENIHIAQHEYLQFIQENCKE